MLKDLVLKNRSYRRFHEDEKISLETLKELIDLARLTPSARNLQPLKYILSNEKDKNEKIYPSLAWAGYLKEWDGPEEGERPSAYIIILGDDNISKNVKWDHSIAVQTILLGAVEKGYGGCIIGAISYSSLRKSLNIPAEYEILLVVALGKPLEEVVIDEISPGDDVKYWRDESVVHHVPKRKLDDLILEL